MPRLLVTLGIVLVVLGLAWPWLQKSGLGRLPGDFVIERGNFRLHFPLTTSIIVSLIVSLLFWLWRGR
jgi:ribose/xylose/arabinose/galactoside ABC-type transport system permease subunit